MLDQCWPTVYDVGPTFVQHWINVLCLLDYIMHVEETYTVYCLLQIEHKFSQSITDVQLQGGKFITEDGRAIGVTGYDSNEIVFFKR